MLRAFVFLRVPPFNSSFKHVLRELSNFACDQSSACVSFYCIGHFPRLFTLCLTRDTNIPQYIYSTLKLVLPYTTIAVPYSYIASTYFAYMYSNLPYLHYR